MVAEKVPHCHCEQRTNLIARAVSIACLRIAHPGPSYVCLDLILELLATELWGKPPKRAAAASHYAGAARQVYERQAS